MHLNEIQRKSQVSFENIIFFDDEYRNISETKKLGVYAVHVSDLNRNEVALILDNWVNTEF